MLASDQRHRHVLASVKASVLYYNKVGATRQMTQGMTKQTGIRDEATVPGMLYASPSQHILLFFSNVLYARHSLN
jgi:hypothetical protein